MRRRMPLCGRLCEEERFLLLSGTQLGACSKKETNGGSRRASQRNREIRTKDKEPLPKPNKTERLRIWHWQRWPFRTEIGRTHYCCLQKWTLMIRMGQEKGIGS